MTTQPVDTKRPATMRLWAEFILLYVGCPLLITATFGIVPLFPMIAGFAALSLFLLQITPGWHWRKLLQGPVLGEWRIIAVFTAITAVTCLIIIFALAPERFLSLPLYRPELWLMILILYPVFSAYPQEIIFRSLFFERYGCLFPNNATAIAANGVAFALGHLFFDNWVTIAMTGIGGAIMGWAYMRNGSVGLAWVLHSVAGQLIFTIGLGIFFYHGAIGATP